MSEKDPSEHLKTYERFCSPRFKNIESSIKDTNGTVHSIDKIVSNGLEDRMIKVEKTCNWLMKTLISLLLLIIASTITLYSTNNKKIDEVLIRMEHDITN